MRLAALSALLALLVPGVVSAQWTNRYPKLAGYSHHVYVEGFELPLLVAGPTDPAPSPDGRTIAISARGWIWLLDTETGVARRATSVKPTAGLRGIRTAAGSRSCATTPSGSRSGRLTSRPVRRRCSSKMNPSFSTRRGRPTERPSTSVPPPRVISTSGACRSKPANPRALRSAAVWRYGRSRSPMDPSPICPRGGPLRTR